MYTKKVIVFCGIVCSLLFLSGCGNKAKNVGIPTQVGTTQVQNTMKIPATKEQCLELVAYGMKVALNKAKWDDAEILKRVQKAADVQTQYNGANLEYENTCAAFMNDTTTFWQEVQKRVDAL